MKLKSILTTILFFWLQCSFATIVVSNGLTKIHELPSGSSYEGVILLQNTGDKPEEFLCYLNDISTSCEGKVSYLEAGINQNSLSSFLSTSVTQASIAPGEEYQLLYRIELPKDSEFKGTLWSLLMIEIVKPINESVTEGGFRVDSKIRYGVQVIANVDAEVNSELKFSDVQLMSDVNGSRIIAASIENKGLFLALPIVEVKIYDNQGAEVKVVQVPSKKVYPGNCQRFDLLIQDLKKGNYKAVLFAEYKEQTVGLNIDLEI